MNFSQTYTSNKKQFLDLRMSLAEGVEPNWNPFLTAGAFDAENGAY